MRSNYLLSDTYELNKIISFENLQNLQNAFAIANNVGSVITNCEGEIITNPVNFPSVCSKLLYSKNHHGHCKNIISKLGKASYKTKITKKICPVSGYLHAVYPLNINKKHIANWIICQAQNNLLKNNSVKSIIKNTHIDNTEAKEMVDYDYLKAINADKFDEITNLLKFITLEITLLGNKNIELGREIKNKKEAEKKLEKSKANLKSLFDTSPQIYFLIDKNYKILTYNRKAHSFIKTIYKKEITQNNYIFNYFSKDDNEFLSHYLEKCFNGENLCYEKKYELNGDYKWFSIHILPAYNSEKEIFAASFSLLDITEKKKADATIEQERNLLLTIINNVPDSIYVKDIQSRFLISNNAVAKLMQATPEELYQKTDFDFYPKKTAQKFYDDEQYIINTGKPLFNIQEKINPENINEKWYSTTKVPIKDDEGKVVGIIGIGHDITEMLKTQQELENAKNLAENADRLKTSFLANMSHEIRTPMNGIIGFADVLQSESISKEEAERYLSIIKKNGLHLLGLINDIIDIAKIESNQVKINKKEFYLNNLLFELYTFFSNNNKLKNKKDIVFNIHYGLPDEESMIFSDEFRIRQILTNLIGNAIKFTESGSIECGYIIRPDEKFIKFFVKDTGIGISEEKKEIIFARFRQADDSSSRKYGGTGLGLAISQGLVTLLGGKIWVESNTKTGSKFYFTIPYISVNNILNKITTSEIELSNNYNWHNKKILIVEDDESSYIFLKHLFQKTNITIIYAQDGKKAIKTFEENQDIDLVLMDLNLPELNGYEATKKIKKIKSTLPIIALTAYFNEETEQECLKQGFDKYLTKPYNEDLILKTINNFFLRSPINI